MPIGINNTQNSSNASYASSQASSTQLTSQNGTSAAQGTSSLEIQGTLSDLTRGRALSPVERCPTEIWLNILSRLLLVDKKQAGLVCKDWEVVIREMLKIVVRAKTSKELNDTLGSFKLGRELHIKLDKAFEFSSNWRNMEENKKVKILAIQTCHISTATEPSTTTPPSTLLQKFLGLKELGFVGCIRFTLTVMYEWLSLNYARKLDLSKNEKPTENPLADLLKKFLNLEKLDLHGCSALEFNSVDEWPTLIHVKKLNLCDNSHITSEKLATLLKKLPNLEELDLFACDTLEFDQVDEWPTLKHLKKFHLTFNSNITNEKLVTLLKKFPNLEELNLRSCEALEFDSANEWPTLIHVKKLNLSSNQHITSEKLATLLKKFPHLEELDLTSCSALEFDSVDKWPTLTHVKKLNLSTNRHITSEKFATLLKKLPSLEELDLDNCSALQFNLVNDWPTLIHVKKLNLSHNPHITSEKLATLLKKFPHLEELNLKDCDALTRYLMDKCSTHHHVKKLIFSPDEVLTKEKLATLLQIFPNLEAIENVIDETPADSTPI